MTFLELTHESGLTSTTLTVDKPEQLTIKNLLDALNIVDSDLVCWIRGPSEEDWVKVLNDQLLQCLLSYYIKFDKFFIVFRHKEQNSPNTTPQLSPVSNKLDNETNIVASQDLPLITTLLENVKEPFTQIPIKESDPSEIMIIENIAVNWTLFPTYVSSKLHDGINLFSIPLKVETKDGELLSIQLTRPTWTRYILRGHKDEFLCALTSI
ncbi:hypothetical protein RclHR1_09060021 [Rhizophagus clarus]|uniref:Uncharacterized protein n=1 Tax=Rhizophagus clarus TaxID=94130 RepID=A0A2Z6S357_9GLOM|nr:hypothetical protein RclHR1_09060021 [Rhizophagus clarus]GES73959.1 hypothetical protein GLOIN_2v1765138 [Rhizophagus clarus]